MKILRHSAWVLLAMNLGVGCRQREEPLPEPVGTVSESTVDATPQASGKDQLMDVEAAKKAPATAAPVPTPVEGDAKSAKSFGLTGTPSVAAIASPSAVKPLVASVGTPYSPGPVRYLQGSFTGTATKNLASILPDGSIWVGKYLNGGMTFSQWSAIPDWGAVYAAGSAAKFYVGDFNGDGKDDILFTWPNGTWWVGTSNGSSFSFALWANIPDWGGILAAGAPARTFVGDFNGDGKTDFLFTWTNGTWWVGQSNGKGFDFKLFANIPSWGGVVDPASSARMFVGDMNGDRKTDFLFTWPDGNVWIGTSDGASFKFTTMASIPGWGGLFDAKSPARFFVADYNGDTKADLMFTWTDGSWWVGTSNGSAMAFTRYYINGGWATVTPSTSTGSFYTVDGNGDKKADSLFTWPGDGSWWMGISNGSSFTFTQWAANGSLSPTISPGTNGNAFALDLNGDGKVDFLTRDSQGKLSVALSLGTSFTGFSNAGNWLPPPPLTTPPNSPPPVSATQAELDQLNALTLEVDDYRQLAIDFNKPKLNFLADTYYQPLKQLQYYVQRERLGENVGYNLCVQGQGNANYCTANMTIGTGLCVQAQGNTNYCGTSNSLGFGLCVLGQHNTNYCNGTMSLGSGLCVLRQGNTNYCGTTNSLGFGLCVVGQGNTNYCTATMSLGSGYCVIAQGNTNYCGSTNSSGFGLCVIGQGNTNYCNAAMTVGSGLCVVGQGNTNYCGTNADRSFGQCVLRTGSTNNCGSANPPPNPPPTSASDDEVNQLNSFVSENDDFRNLSAAYTQPKLNFIPEATYSRIRSLITYINREKGGEHVGYSLCVQGQGNTNYCNQQMTIGSGLCVIAQGNTNYCGTTGSLGFGLCVLGQGNTNYCNTAMSIGSGLCVMAQKNTNYCGTTGSLGFGLCVTGQGNTNYCNAAMSLGSGYCVLAQKNTNYCGTTNSSGFGLCVIGQGNTNYCNASMSVGSGLCVVGQGNTNYCGTNSSRNFGLCVLSRKTTNGCTQ